MDVRGPVIVDLPDELPVRPRRRIPAAVGIAVLLVIALGLATVSGARERATAGSPAAGPRAQLPVDGDCLRWDTDPTRPTAAVAGTVRTVGCEELHQGQVQQAWRIGSQPPASSIEAGCSLGDRVSGFTVMSPDWDGGSGAFSTTVITSGTEGVDFLACVLIVRDTSPPLADLRMCLDETGLGVGCQQPHAFERIGTFTPQEKPSPDGRRPTSTCDDFAARTVGSPSPFVGGDALTTRVLQTGAGGLQDVARDFCDVVAPVGRTLVGTVVGLGDAPLPLG